MLDDKRTPGAYSRLKRQNQARNCYRATSIHRDYTARHGALFEVEFTDPRPVLDIFNAIGHMPLPPHTTVRRGRRPRTVPDGLQPPPPRRPPLAALLMRAAAGGAS